MYNFRVDIEISCVLQLFKIIEVFKMCYSLEDGCLIFEDILEILNFFNKYYFKYILNYGIFGNI